MLLTVLSPQLASAQDCLGDCNGDGRVAVNELVIGVNVALQRAEISTCEAFDDGSGEVGIAVLIGAVLNALEGCGAATPTPAATATPTTAGATVFQGALPRTSGRFSFQGSIGIDGADTECDEQFAGSHACTIGELRAAESAGELDGATDTAGVAVTSFWAIDPTRPADEQCEVSVPWDYATAHTGQFADVVALDNGTGALGALQENAVCATQRWVGCCL